MVHRVQIAGLTLTLVGAMFVSGVFLYDAFTGGSGHPAADPADDVPPVFDRPPHEDLFDGLPPGWTNLPPPPEVRTAAAAVWTGTHLIVWGGYEFSGYSDEKAQGTGFVFDATAERWRPIAASPLEARNRSAFAWTGAELLIFGGERGASGVPLGDGAAYDPVTDAWRSLPAAPLAPRAGHAVWTGREFIVWGSRSRTERHRDGAAYDPATDSWRTIAAAPITLTDATALWSGQEMIVLGAALHGGNVPETPHAIGAAYDPSSDSWRLLPDSELSPQASTAAWDGREMIAWDYEHRTAAYDPETDRWRALEDVPLRSMECSPQALTLRRAVFGEYCGQMARFDVASDRWHEVTPPFEYWTWEPVPANEVVVMLARELASGEERMLAYFPPGSGPA